MNVRDLIPWGRHERSAVPGAMGGDASPFLTLHREMNRLFDDVFGRLEGAMPSLMGRMSGWPRIEAVETDRDIRISAELPGMDEKDVEVLCDGDALIVRGERKAETQDSERRFTERWYGRFERVVPLPFPVEEDRAEASFRNGLLTVVLPRSAKGQEKLKRIAVNKAGQA